MGILGRIFGSAKSTVKGVLTAVGAGSAAGIVAAAQQFGQTGDTKNWTPYAAAAVAAAVPAIVGAFSHDDDAETKSANSIAVSAKKASDAVLLAGEQYAAQKADEVIAKLQEQLAAAQK